MSPTCHGFPEKSVRALLDRYDVSYYQEKNCIEYFIMEKKTGEVISRSIIFSLSPQSNEIRVVKFWPQLRKQPHSKYLSAACFYYLIHHFAKAYHLKKGCPICLETVIETHQSFYSKLQDFHLVLKGIKMCKTAYVCGDFPDLEIDTFTIKQQRRSMQQIPFLVA